MNKHLENKKLTIDLAVKSYQIFLAIVVVNPLVIGQFKPLLTFIGILLIVICVFIAYYFANKKPEKEE